MPVTADRKAHLASCVRDALVNLLEEDLDGDENLKETWEEVATPEEHRYVDRCLEGLISHLDRWERP